VDGLGLWRTMDLQDCQEGTFSTLTILKIL